MLKLFKKILKYFYHSFILKILFLYSNAISKKKIKKTNDAILFLGNFSKYGGARTYIENLMKLFNKCSNLIYFLQDKKNIDADGLLLLERKNINCIQYNYSFDKPLDMLISIVQISKIIKKYNVLTTFISERDCGYYLPCILFKTQNILVEHTIPTYKLDVYRTKIINKIKDNSKIICVSYYQKNKTIENWGKELSKYCSVIYNSATYNSFFFKEDRLNLIKRKIIITVAHFIEYKNPDMWLSIANNLTAKYKDLEFRWIGDGDDLIFYRNKIKYNNAIKLLGYCNHDQTKEEYESAYLYLALSKIENLSISVIDALQAGLPSVVLNTGGLPEVVDSEKCGYVVNTEEEAIEKIEKLLNNAELYSRMSANSIDRYNTLFSSEKWEMAIKSIIPFCK
jgi:glycosyltransferase involved in cell wall biosynthesis